MPKFIDSSEMGPVSSYGIFNALAEQAWNMFLMKEQRGKDVTLDGEAFSRIFHQYVGSITMFGRLATALNLLTTQDAYLKGGEGFLFEEAEKLLMAWASDQGKDFPASMDGLLVGFRVPRYYET